jgi:uncharacterized protein YbaP (TraB family)
MTNLREPVAAAPSAMRRRRRPSAWLKASAFALFVCSTSGHVARAEDPPAAISDAERSRIVRQIDAIGRRGFLYEVTQAANDSVRGKRLFLYGTIHIGRPGGEPFNLPVIEALRQSWRLALEADPTDSDAARHLVQQLGQYGDGDGLERHVPPPLMARVEAFGEKAGMPSGRIGRFKPWLLANMVALKQISTSGLDPDLGSELYLAGFARGVGIPIVEIEGMENQFRLLAALPDPLQAAQLGEALDDIEGGDARDDSRALFELWLTGDAAAGTSLVALMHEQAADRVFERYFVKTLIDDRNRSMADKAENYLERPGNTFFAVGSLHLFGESGLIRELERRGYRVVDLQAPFVASH